MVSSFFVKNIFFGCMLLSLYHKDINSRYIGIYKEEKDYETHNYNE